MFFRDELDLRPRGDAWLLVVTIVLVAIGVLMVFSATAVSSTAGEREMGFVARHVVSILIGLAALYLLNLVSPYALKQIAPWVLILGVVLLILVAIPGIGHKAGGARRWIVLGPVRLQPGELIKFAAMLALSAYISRFQDRMVQLVPGVIAPLGGVCVICALLLVEPDFGSTVVVLGVSFAQLLCVARMSHLLMCGGVGLGTLMLLVVSSPYRFERFKAFLDPFSDPADTGYQLVQSLIAVGSGGFWGEGLGAGKQKLFYLPAAHTDFIFAVTAEEWGLVGASFLVLLFLVFIWRGVKVASRLAAEPYLSSLAIGSAMLIGLPALLNMGVVLGLLPTKGLVLPLVAYGGTAMIVNLAVVGLLLRLSSIGGRR